MRILILGATGLLGHRLFIELSKHHEVWGTYRDDDIPTFGNKDYFVEMLDCNWQDADRAIEITTPSVVINCTAVIPQRHYIIQDMIRVNSEFPHDLATICRGKGIRLIHFSTDGVFSGKRGYYSEDDTPDATDVYGMTKRLGEISDKSHVLTLRCCPIGREIGAKKSLVEWFLAQTGTIKGYAKAQFCPLSTHEIARMLNDYVLPNGELHGLYHVGSQPIDKFSVLGALKDIYKRTEVTTLMDLEPKPDRSLNTVKFDLATGYRAPSWGRGKMLEEMAADNALYEGEHAHG
jgi:dTDP-4-dehydrorhamnose reductase